MSDHDDSQERTEEATPKRKEEAREKGQIVRSRELNSFLLLLLSSVIIAVFSRDFLHGFYEIFKSGIGFYDYSVNSPINIIGRLYFLFVEALKSIWILLASIMIIAIISPVFIGGFSFYLESIIPQWSRLDPTSGLQRMFSLKSIVELIKALIKFFILIIGLLSCLYIYHKKIFWLSKIDVYQAILSSLDILEISFIIMVSFMIVIVLFDIPVQLIEHAKQTKMTKQEVREEYKETEGKPEVKSKIKQLQQKIAKSRMMAKVPKADVVISNPTHYAVALKYDQGSMSAPIVVAKGADFIAQQIMKIAKQADVPLISLPALARSIYHTTELEKPIPSGLYVAVAQVLAYLYQLQLHTRGQGDKPKKLKEVPIPPDLKY